MAQVMFGAIQFPELYEHLLTFSGGYGTGSSGHLISSLSEKYRQGMSLNGRTLSHTAKFIAMFGAYIRDNYGQAIYAKAQTLGLELRRKYNEILMKYDAILMP